MALPRRRRMDRHRDEAKSIDIDAAGLHPCRGLVGIVQQGLERGISAARLETGGDADARAKALRPKLVALPLQAFIIGMSQNLGDDCVIIAAVVTRPARDQIGKLIATDEIAPADFDAVEAERGRDLVDRGLDRIIGRRLTEAADRFLGGLVRRHRNGAIFHALDLVGPDDRADRLAELERRTPGIGTGIVERTHLHRLDDAIVVERDFDIGAWIAPEPLAMAHEPRGRAA